MRSISKESEDLIIRWEVSSKTAYERKYRKPIWPKHSSGVTVAFGYDVGYATKEQLWKDWKGIIPDSMIVALERAVGVTGQSAALLAEELHSEVDIPWEAAYKVFKKTVLPRWISTTERTFPNTNLLSDDCMGALVSLLYNRGPDLKGGRRTEMRNIKELMVAKDFKGIPAEFRSMKRIWPDSKGLQDRRESEAALFERGLDKPAPSNNKEPIIVGGTIATAVTYVFWDWIKDNPWETGLIVSATLGLITLGIYLYKKRNTNV